jgi:hypothetical protein
MPVTASAADAFEQRVHGERGVPHGRDARLHRERVFGLERERRQQPFDAARHHRMVVRVAERLQRDERVHPRRLDAAPRAVALLMVDDPALAGAQRATAQRLPRQALVQPQHAVSGEEEVAPRDVRTVAAEADAPPVLVAHAELRDAEPRI